MFQLTWVMMNFIVNIVGLLNSISFESILDQPVSKSGIDTFIGSFQHNAIIHLPANTKGVDTIVITKQSSSLALVNIRLVIPYGGHVCAFGNDGVKFDYDQSTNRLVYE